VRRELHPLLCYLKAGRHGGCCQRRCAEDGLKFDSSSRCHLLISACSPCELCCFSETELSLRFKIQDPRLSELELFAQSKLQLTLHKQTWGPQLPAAASYFVPRCLWQPVVHLVSNSPGHTSRSISKHPTFPASQSQKHRHNMATQQDLQELLRLITVTRKTPMLQAMTQIKSLQAADLRR
jgi:hypothetical protein